MMPRPGPSMDASTPAYRVPHRAHRAPDLERWRMQTISSDPYHWGHTGPVFEPSSSGR